MCPATAYDVANREGQDATVSLTSTGTANFQTATRPKWANAFLITVETNACRISFDGANPDATSHVFPKDAVPQFYPFRMEKIVVASTIAGNSIVNLTWLEAI